MRYPHEGTSVTGMTVYHPNASKLQEAIKFRRAELDLTQRDIPPLGGPSRIVVARIEMGETPEAITDNTLIKLDRALKGTDGKWPVGTSRSILEGVEPGGAGIERDSPGIDLNRLRQFVSAVNRMQKMAAQEIKNLPPELLDAMNEVTEKQLDLITDLNDRNTSR